MSPQRPLFDDLNPPQRPAAERSLTLRADAGRPLSPKQKAFNRLITRIERLQAQLATEQQRLDEALIHYAAHVRPRRTQVIALRTDLLLLLRPFLTDRRLKAPDRRILKTLAIAQLDDVLAIEPQPSIDVRELFEQLHGQSYDDAIHDDMETMRAEMEDMFGGLGLDVELSGFKPGMTEEELAAQTAEFAAQLRQQAEAASAATTGRPQSKREAREADRKQRIEDARKTGLSSIYRRLAKALHPDLEPDPEARERKGALMQELTAAHARRDLHTLLRLELEWIHHEGSDTARLADDALAIYTDALTQQASQLDFETSMLRRHPKYAEVVAVSEFGVPNILDGPTEAARLDHALEALSAGVERLQSEHALEEIRQTIALQRSDTRRRRRR